jgi:membrane protein DedA with SNARE-associated domain
MALGIVGLPIPDETILTFVGYLVSQNKLHLLPTIISSFLGSICGISISFIIGKTIGIKFLHRYGKYFHITESKLHKTKKWFESYGEWLFLFGYFIPGVRHLTAIIAGSAETKYSKFALFAYSGGLIWTLTFITIGFTVGKKWMLLVHQIQKHILIVTFIIIILLIGYFVFRSIYRSKNRSIK